ncbi:hypothetical protein AB0G35_22545 [Streptomyces sp. NPDC021749]|uniref:hypothetical protein n=1 Tax=Streptomyces sp. NPDC021749 TaxID=3154905 RepID=UPI0033DCF651
MSSGDVVLARVRRALSDVSRGAGPGGAEVGEPPLVRDYRLVHGARTAVETVDLLAENLADYRALVHRSDVAGLPGS